MVQLTKILSGDTRTKPMVVDAGLMPEPDVHVITSGGGRIPAHSKILASASPVLENIIEEKPQKRRSSERKIPILGVPSDAVFAFVQYLYSSRCTDEQTAKYGVHLLALSHVYSVPLLKQRCTRALCQALTFDNVVDMLQLARLCDAPNLYLRCMKLLSDHFNSVEQTEAWKFLQDHDPYLELEILQFIDQAETRKKRTRRDREAQNLYVQLSEAMDCLEHICTDGCTSVRPHGSDKGQRGPCEKFTTCNGIQLLIKHFGSCKKKRVNGGCVRCKRMWQLFRLHSSVCDDQLGEECRVPLCRQFKLKAQEVDDERWRLLVRKVVSARAVCSLSFAKKTRQRYLPMDFD